MKRLFIFLFLSLFLNCKETPKKTPQAPPEKRSRASTKHRLVDTSQTSQRAFPKLNDKNAMEFFLDYEKDNKENKVRMTTDMGIIDILLFKKTKFHRANFIFLTKQNYFKDTQFYRVINNYMIQGGGSDDRKTALKRANIGRYLLPTDTNRGFKHDRGTISMPSSEIDNPYKLASPFDFFIVQKKGGAHFLDGDYTIFGKVIKGMDVVDKIAAVPTDDDDWPLKNIYIRKVEILK